MLINFMEIQELRAIKDQKGYVVGTLGNAVDFVDALTSLKYTTLSSDANVTFNMKLEQYVLSTPIEITNAFGAQFKIVGAKSAHAFDTSVQAVSINIPLNKVTFKVVEKLPLNINNLGLFSKNGAVANRGVFQISSRVDDYTLECYYRGADIASNLPGSLEIVSTIFATNMHGLYLNDKNLGFIDNVVFIGAGAALPYSGIYSTGGKVLCGVNVGFIKFYNGIYSESAGLVEAEYSSADGCTNSYYATYGGIINAYGTTSTNKILNDYLADNGGMVIPQATIVNHTHLNKGILDLIQEALTTALKNSYDAAVLAMHSHSNKATLDLISSAKLTKDFRFDDVSPKTLFTIPAGYIVTKCKVIFNEAFDDAAATIVIGDAGLANRFMEADENVPYEICACESERYFPVAAPLSVLASINKLTSSQGGGLIIIEVERV